MSSYDEFELTSDYAVQLRSRIGVCEDWVYSWMREHKAWYHNPPSSNEVGELLTFLQDWVDYQKELVQSSPQVEKIRSEEDGH